MDNPIIIRHNELLNRVVMERDRMQEVGRVEQLWMYPQAHRVMGIISRGRRFGGKRWVYKLPQIDSLTQGTIWVDGAPTETTGEQIRRLESLIDHEVWVDGGDRLGRIIDCLFNRKTGAITQYLLIDGPLKRWVGEPMTLSPSEIKGFGNFRVLVDERSRQRLRRERPSLQDTWNNLREQAQAEYEQVTEEAKSAQQLAAERAERLRQQAAEQAQTWSQRLSSQAQTWGQRLTQQTRELSEEFKTQSSDWREQAADWRETAREQVSEFQAGEWGEVPQVRPPEETTWVDEAGELPPARPASRPAPRPAPQHPPQPSRRPHDSATDPPSEWRSPWPREAEEGRLPLDLPPPQPTSRDNPWGYENSPRSPDTPTADVERAEISPEDLRDDDPWIC